MDEFTRGALPAQTKDDTKIECEADSLRPELRQARLELFESLDGVIGAFLNTNIWRGENLTLDDLIKVSSKRYMRYKQKSIPYRATITRIEDHDATWQRLKLVNDGFKHTAKSGEPTSGHGLTGWTTPGGRDFLQHFLSLRGRLEGAYDEGRVSCRSEERRVDIKLYPSNETLPHLMFTIEEGYPDWSDFVGRQSI